MGGQSGHWDVVASGRVENGIEYSQEDVGGIRNWYIKEMREKRH